MRRIEKSFIGTLFVRNLWTPWRVRIIAYSLRDGSGGHLMKAASWDPSLPVHRVRPDNRPILVLLFITVCPVEGS